eukprot:jgi/Chlat1/7296/Chrsp58S00541
MVADPGESEAAAAMRSLPPQPADAPLHAACCLAMLALAPPTFLALTAGITAPYGRYVRDGWGYVMNGKLAWVLQEFPSFIIPLGLLLHERMNGRTLSPANTLLLYLFLLHYANRAFIYPLRMRGGKGTPFSVCLMSFVFCVVNGYMQGRDLTRLRVIELNPRLFLGVVIWAAGLLINQHSDSVLRNLRKPGENGYKIPRGGCFELVSAAHYFGEIVEWAGFAVASWSLASAAFALFTFCNIGPRGKHHHEWYLNKFEDYPRTRRAVIPFVW